MKTLENVVVLELDKPNANGRTYTSEVGAAIVEQFDKRNEEGHSVLGELEYPKENFDVIQLDRVSHQIKDLRVEDGKLIGTMVLMDTPMGKIAQQLYDNVHHGFRPRGYATIGADGVVTNYNLVSIDMVSDPA